MTDKMVHVVWITAWHLEFARGTPQQMLWDRKSRCFVITFCEDGGIMRNIPVAHILRWTEFDRVTDDSQKQEGSQATQASR